MKFANRDDAAVTLPQHQRPKTCTRCRLHNYANYNCVPPRGADHPHIMLVGEAPGQEEDRYGQPFVGRSGKLLDELIGKAGIDPRVLRWTNSVRCMPKINGKIEKPAPDDVKTCVWSHLLYEIATQKPHLIVALGKTASVALTGNRSAIDRMRGFKHPFRFPPDFIAWAETQGMILYEGIPEKTGGIPPQQWNPKTCRSIEYPVVVTDHPAHALRKKGQKIGGLIEGDLIYARKIVYNEPRLPDVDYRLVNSVDELNQWADYLVGYYRAGHTPFLSFDFETGGPDDIAGLREFDPTTEIVSFQVSWAEKKAILVPVSHPEGNFADAFGIAAIRAFLHRLFVEEGTPIAGANLPFDYQQAFAKFGIRIREIALDVKFAHQCLYAGDEPNDLDYLSAKYVGMQGYGDGLKENMEKLPKGKKAFQNLPLDQAYIDYACGDTDSVYRMVPLIQRELVEKGLWDTYDHVFRRALIPIAEMRINGLPIDHDVYEWLRYEMPQQIEAIMEPIRRSPFYPNFLQRRGATPEQIQMLVAGNAPPKVKNDFDFNPNSNPQKVELLFDVMGLPKNADKISEKTGDPSTDKQVMGELHDLCASNGWTDHLAVVQAIQEHAVIAKLHSAYIVNLPSVVHDHGEKRHDLFAHYWPTELQPWYCHPRFKLDGTQTGRLSAADPAIHNMPGKSAVKRLFKSRWRERGGCHLQFDYGAMEVRILACSVMANDPTLKAAFAQGYDAHKYVASMIFGKSIDDVTPDERKVCKTVNFAVLYGAGPDNVAGVVGVSRAKAERFISDYLGALPHVRQWKDSIQKFALSQGYVKSAFGRIRYLSTKVYSKGDVERRAVNTPIQSTASDVTLTSYIRIWHKLRELGFLSLPYLFVHDSLGFDVFPGEFFDLWEMLAYEMAVVPPTIYPWLDVPLEVDSDAGYSWGAMGNVQRFDRTNWKVVGKESNCAALVHQLQMAGHQISYTVAEEVLDGKPASAWYLRVSR